MTSLPSRLTIFFIISLSIILRIYRLGTYDFWFDEVLCVFQKEELGGILNGRVLDSNPPLYFLLLNLWGKFGSGEFWLRLPSVIFGVLNIYALYAVAKKLFDEQTAQAASFLLAISPFHIYYSQEVKMYSLFILLSFLSFSSLLLAIKTGEKRYCFFYFFSTALLLYTHYFAMYVVSIELISLAFCAFLMKEKRKVLASLVISLIAVGIAYLPWIPVMLKEHFFRTSGFVSTWIPSPEIKSLFYTLKNFSVGFSSPRINYFIASFAYGIMFIIGLRGIIKERSKEYFILPIFVILTPLILFVVSLYHPVYLDRYISYILPLFLLIAAVEIKKIKKGGVVAILIMATIFSYFGYKDMYEEIPYLQQAPGEHARIQMREPVEYLQSKWEPGDIVGHSCRSTLLSFEYYWKNSPEQKLLATSMFERYPQPSDWKHSNLLPDVVPDSINGKGRIWLVLSWWDPLDRLDPISKSLKDWMDSHFYLEGEKKFKGIFIFQYSRRNIT